MKSMSELHRFSRSETGSVRVDVGKGVVNDSTRAAVALGYDTHGREPQTWQRPDLGVRQHNPKALGDHGGHFDAQEDFVFFGRRMATTGHGCIPALQGPGIGSEDNGCTIVA